MAVDFLSNENIWFEKFKYDDAERRFYEQQVNGPAGSSSHQQVMCSQVCWSLRAEGHCPPGCILLRCFHSMLLFSKCERLTKPTPPCLCLLFVHQNFSSTSSVLGDEVPL